MSVLDGLYKHGYVDWLTGTVVGLPLLHGTEWHIPWHYSPERNRADTRVPQPINYSISYLVAMGILAGNG